MHTEHVKKGSAGHNELASVLLLELIVSSANRIV
jgi:hypothetical protein